MGYAVESLSFFAHLDAQEKEVLWRNTKDVHYKKGEAILSPQNDCVGVLLIQSGELCTYILSDEGRQVTLYRLYPGDVCILSASCLLKSISFDVYIDAEVDSTVRMISAPAFASMQEKNIYVENFALKLSVERFSDVMWAMEQILFSKFDARLAAFLFDESNRLGTNEIALTHEQIAKYLGSAREVVSRMLKQFETEGIVALYRGGVRIEHMDFLRAKMQNAPQDRGARI